MQRRQDIVTGIQFYWDITRMENTFLVSRNSTPLTAQGVLLDNDSQDPLYYSLSMINTTHSSILPSYHSLHQLLLGYIYDSHYPCYYSPAIIHSTHSTAP